MAYNIGGTAIDDAQYQKLQQLDALAQQGLITKAQASSMILGILNPDPTEALISQLMGGGDQVSAQTQPDPVNEYFSGLGGGQSSNNVTVPQGTSLSELASITNPGSQQNGNIDLSNLVIDTGEAPQDALGGTINVLGTGIQGLGSSLKALGSGQDFSKMNDSWSADMYRNNLPFQWVRNIVGGLDPQAAEQNQKLKDLYDEQQVQIALDKARKEAERTKKLNSMANTTLSSLYK